MKACIFVNNYFKSTLFPLLPKRLCSLILVGNFVYWVELCPFTLVVEFQKCSLILKGLYKAICDFLKRNVQTSFNGTYFILFYILFWLYALEEFFLPMVC